MKPLISVLLVVLTVLGISTLLTAVRADACIAACHTDSECEACSN